MPINFEQTIKNCFTLWTRDSKTWKYIFGIYLVSIVFLVVLGALLFVLFGPVVQQVMANPALLEDGDQFMQVLATAISSLLVFIVVLIPAILAVAFVNAYLYALITLRALQLNGINTAAFSAGKFLRMIILWVYLFIAVIFSIYHKLMMVFSVFYIALVLATVAAFFVSMQAGAILALIDILLFFPYIIILIYNSYRLSLACQVFLHKEVAIKQAAKESWAMTKGNVLMMLVSVFVIGIIIMVITYVFSFLSQLVGGALDAVFGTAIVFTLIFSFGSSLIIDPVLQVVQIQILPAIYAQLLGQSVSSSVPSKKFAFNPPQ